MCAVFFLEFGEACPLLKEVVKGPPAIGDGLLQQLRIDFFQSLETRLVLRPAQFNRKLRPGDGFAVLLIGLFSTLDRPVEDEPSRACANQPAANRKSRARSCSTSDAFSCPLLPPTQRIYGFSVTWEPLLPSLSII